MATKEPLTSKRSCSVTSIQRLVPPNSESHFSGSRRRSHQIDLSLKAKDDTIRKYQSITTLEYIDRMKADEEEEELRKMAKLQVETMQYGGFADKTSCKKVLRQLDYLQINETKVDYLPQIDWEKNSEETEPSDPFRSRLCITKSRSSEQLKLPRIQKKSS